uniref:Hemerythrin-like domain-containing protein n=1 Tax=Cyanothece sp. (strain PCC 7425 / ATCC 29141) TaxID=395961 RepID=B8HL90_CYAP4
MATFQMHQTVGAIVREHPALSRLFEQAQVDYCCGGKKTLAAACQHQGIDPQQFLTQLEAAVNLAEPEADVLNLSLSQLADRIEQTHHVYLRTELPRLEGLTAKVARVHGDKDLRLPQVRDIFLALSQELTTHLLKEEQILFPLIRQLETSDARPVFHCGSLANPVGRMEFEHEEAGIALAQLRQLTDDFTPPDWACNTYRAMLDGLFQFEQDMHQHIHKENNVLFPAAISLEQQKS